MNILKAIQIQGWMTHLELLTLANKAKNCKNIVEIGCYKGRSTRALVDNCKGTVYAVDPWEEKYYKDPLGQLFHNPNMLVADEFKYNLQDVLTDGKLIIMKGHSYEVDLKHLYGKTDLVFIDGDHTYNGVLFDIALGLKLLRPGGLLMGHDYSEAYWLEVKKAVDKIFPNVIVEQTIWMINKC
jgi:predicted O-methyltransferase YrrM